jgi:DNA (cytosine-5)-methyltransferase 1
MIRIGTDCSGIEAPIEALKNICKNYNLEYKHIFSSEIDKYAIQYIKDNHNPDIFYGDINERDINTIPDIDIYVCGFPCQPFSRANKNKNNDDPNLKLYECCIDVIIKKQPKIFILENVKSFITLDGGSYFKDMKSKLKKLDKYKIYWKIINTKDYGIPQNRERLYLIGLDKNCERFEFPDKQTLSNINNYIDNNDNTKTEIKNNNIELFNNIPNNAVFIDIGFRKSKFPNSNKWSPCITAQPNLWCVPKQRKANINEYLMLQGFVPTGIIKNITTNQLKIKIGNSMSVNVIEILLIECLTKYALL